MDTKNKAERWRQADDDPAFIYALDEFAGVNIFDLKISGGYHNGKRTSPEEIAEIAALIVTAPDLLAVCEMESGFPEINFSNYDESDVRRLQDWAFAFVDAARAAIAKAKPNADAKLID